MKKWIMPWIIALCPFLMRCNDPDTEARIKDAAALVEKRTGLSPEWDEPWDESHAVLSGVETLELQLALETALRNNRALRADIEMIGQADAELLQAGLMSNPVMSFMVMFPSGGGRTMLRGNALPMQPLQDLWLIPARKKVAAAMVQDALLRAADRSIETVATVKRVYVELQYAQQAIELIRTNMELVEQSTSIIQIRQSAGQASQVEVSLSRIRHERLRSELLAMQTELAKNKHELLMLLGLAEAATDWRVTPIGEVDIAPPPPRDEVDLILLAADQRLDLKSREWQTEAALRRITLSRREGWPDLALGFTFERAPRGRTRGVSRRALSADTAAQSFVNGLNGAMEEAPMVSQIAPLPRPQRDVTYTLGPMIEMEIPIFDWGQAQSAKAVHEYHQRLAEYDDRLQQIVQSVRTALVRQEEAYQQLQLFREVILPEVERNLELARQTFASGQTDLTIYLQTQEDAITTRLRMLDFLKAYRLLEAELERAVGGARCLDADYERDADPSALENAHDE